MLTLVANSLHTCVEHCRQTAVLPLVSASFELQSESASQEKHNDVPLRSKLYYTRRFSIWDLLFNIGWVYTQPEQYECVFYTIFIQHRNAPGFCQNSCQAALLRAESRAEAHSTQTIEKPGHSSPEGCGKVLQNIMFFSLA